MNVQKLIKFKRITYAIQTGGWYVKYEFEMKKTHTFSCSLVITRKSVCKFCLSSEGCSVNIESDYLTGFESSIHLHKRVC